MLKKDLIKLCPLCNKYYYADKPHAVKSFDHCKKAMEEFRKQNNIPPYEVWEMTVNTDLGMFIPQYNAEETMRNFMRMMYEREVHPMIRWELGDGKGH